MKKMILALLLPLLAISLSAQQKPAYIIYNNNIRIRILYSLYGNINNIIVSVL